MLAMSPNFWILRGCPKTRTPARKQEVKVKDSEWGGSLPPPSSEPGQPLERGKCAEGAYMGLNPHPNQYNCQRGDETGTFTTRSGPFLHKAS